MAIDHKLERLKRYKPKEDDWETVCIFECPEQVLPKFYNENGSEIALNDQRDHTGRQRVMFFLKTISSMHRAPQPAIFSTQSIDTASVGMGSVSMETKYSEHTINTAAENAMAAAAEAAAAAKKANEQVEGKIKDIDEQLRKNAAENEKANRMMMETLTNFMKQMSINQTSVQAQVTSVAQAVASSSNESPLRRKKMKNEPTTTPNQTSKQAPNPIPNSTPTNTNHRTPTVAFKQTAQDPTTHRIPPSGSGN